MNRYASLLAVAIAIALTACAGGGVTPALQADLTARLASAQPAITSCYQRSLTTNRKLRGMYVVQFATAPNTGQFTEINLRRDEPQDPVLRFCVISELAKLRLAKPTSTRIEVESAPIKFDWSNP